MNVTDIRIHQQSNTIDVTFDDGKTFFLSAFALRQNSPSAEMRGHGGQTPPPVTIDPNVRIIGVEPVGHYAIRITFSDGHNSGLYAWEYLHQLGERID